MSVSVGDVLIMNAHLNENCFFLNILWKHARHNVKMHFGVFWGEISIFSNRVLFCFSLPLSSTLGKFGGLCVACFRHQQAVGTAVWQKCVAKYENMTVVPIWVIWGGPHWPSCCRWTFEISHWGCVHIQRCCFLNRNKLHEVKCWFCRG